MPDIPDIGEMDPDRWLSQMHRLRDDLLEAVAAELTEHETADRAASSLETVLRQYELTDDDRPAPLLETRAEDGRLIFSCEESDESVELVREDREHWWFDDADFPDEDRRSVDELHAALAEEVLQLVPWWTEDAFTEKAGEPEKFQ